MILHLTGLVQGLAHRKYLINNSSFLPGFYVLNAGVSFHGSITNPCQVVRYYYHYYLCSTGKKISSYLLSVPH